MLIMVVEAGTEIHPVNVTEWHQSISYGYDKLARILVANTPSTKSSDCRLDIAPTIVLGQKAHAQREALLRHGLTALTLDLEVSIDIFHTT